MANNKNLIRNEDLTPSERRERARKAGKASAKKRREKKTMSEQMELLLSLPFNINEESREKMESMGIKSEEMDNKMAVVVSIWRKALSGDLQAISMLKDMIGETMRPKENSQNQNAGNSFIEALNNSSKEVWKNETKKAKKS